MTLAEIQNLVMFQTNNDADDLGDYLPYLKDYINDGYDRLVFAFCGQHSGQDSADYPVLNKDKEMPNLPDWTHAAIADWATWLIYRNGNAQKQSRGYQFRTRFEAVEGQLRSMTAGEKGLSDSAASSRRYIFNIPR